MATETKLIREDISRLRRDIETVKELLLLKCNQEISLEEEIVSWERASEEDLLSFEKSL